MALINCPDCNSIVSDKAIQCPKCAYPISSYNTNQNIITPREIQKHENVTVNIQQPNLNSLLVLTSKKSEGLAFLLTFLFGPFGLFYANPKKAGPVFLFTIGAAILVLLLSGNDKQAEYIWIGLFGLIISITSIILGMQGVNEYNQSLLENLNLEEKISPRRYANATNISQKYIVNDINQEYLNFLNQLITEERKKIFSGKNDHIPKTIRKLTSDFGSCKNLAHEYKNQFGKDLIEDIISTSSSLEKIYFYVEPLCDLGFCKKAYPHELIT